MRQPLTYGVAANLAHLVETGAKLGTLRPVRECARGPEVGDPIRLYVGLGSKRPRLVLESVVADVTDLAIVPGPGHAVTLFVGHTRVEPQYLDVFARFEGFANGDELIEELRARHGLPFNGYLIAWVAPLPRWVRKH
jgi:hypothetical protein